MAQTAYDKIELHEMVEFFSAGGLSAYGEVVGKDENNKKTIVTLFDETAFAILCYNLDMYIGLVLMSEVGNLQILKITIT